MKKDEYEKRRVEQLVAQDSERLMKLKLREMMEQNRTLQLKAVKDQEKDFKEMMRIQLAEEDLALEQLREKREKEADVKGKKENKAGIENGKCRENKA